MHHAKYKHLFPLQNEHVQQHRPNHALVKPYTHFKDGEKSEA